MKMCNQPTSFPYEHRALISLNTDGIVLLEKGMFREASNAFIQALNIVKTMQINKVSSNKERNETISTVYEQVITTTHLIIRNKANIVTCEHYHCSSRYDWFGDSHSSQLEGIYKNSIQNKGLHERLEFTPLLIDTDNQLMYNDDDNVDYESAIILCNIGIALYCTSCFDPKNSLKLKEKSLLFFQMSHSIVNTMNTLFDKKNMNVHAYIHCLQLEVVVMNMLNRTNINLSKTKIIVNDGTYTQRKLFLEDTIKNIEENNNLYFGKLCPGAQAA